MTDKCKWMEPHLEAYFSESIDPPTRARLEQHVEGCTDCRAELDEFAQVDVLVSAHFRQQVARAGRTAHWPIRPLRLAGAFGAVLVAAAAIWISSGMSGGGMPGGEMSGPVIQDTVGAVQQAAVSSPETDAPDVNGDKAEEELDARLAKADPVLDAASDARFDAAPTMDGPAVPVTRFHVQDAAGYFHTLEDFSGSVLVLGVVDRDPAGSAAFAQAYERYGSDAKVRFLGVPADGIEPGPVRFPTMVNRESSLLETRTGEFAIVAPDGTVHARGLLDEETLRSTIDASLQLLGAKVPGDEE